MATVKSVWFWCFFSFIGGLLFSNSLYIVYSKTNGIKTTTTTTVVEVVAAPKQIKSNITLTSDNIHLFYDEYYRFYELNHHWFVH